MENNSNCIFCKIVAGQIPSNKIYEDDDILAFHDISPLRDIHALIIPKKHIASLADTENSDAEVLGKMMTKIKDIAKLVGANDGFRCIINTKEVGGQEVPHLHIHLISTKDGSCVGKMIG